MKKLGEEKGNVLIKHSNVVISCNESRPLRNIA
jgi:hypothetical protein